MRATFGNYGMAQLISWKRRQTLHAIQRARLRREEVQVKGLRRAVTLGVKLRTQQAQKKETGFLQSYLGFAGVLCVKLW